MSAFSVDILTPSKIVGKDLPADSVLIPTEAGEINILEGHTHLVGKLDTGILQLISDKKESYFTVTTGTCKILGNKIVILSRVTEKVDEIDGERAKNALARAQEKLKNSELLQPEELSKYKRKMERAELRLKMLLMKKK